MPKMVFCQEIYNEIAENAISTITVIKNQITVIEISILLSLLSLVDHCNREVAEDFFSDLLVCH
ncbi:hypothetical protein AMJ52_04285 [candidate division TA06 bacterium DG_78]|uniref:Uncharacterized protein n=1 Tax=candidate division TA06 bacterium DG_78 TaxID=1703772 RepID=A0A0S7YEE1_UNCT6|nr:MAG: hypothetical protein AMJ52_04285 [candidate division TA06 bacterium DG_78]